MEAAGGRALRALLAAVGLLSALSAAGTLFLLAQWRELGAAMRELELGLEAARQPPAPGSGRDLLGGTAGPSRAPPGAPRSKRSRRGERARGHVRAETDELMMMLTYSLVPVGQRSALRLWNARRFSGATANMGGIKGQPTRFGGGRFSNLCSAGGVARVLSVLRHTRTLPGGILTSCFSEIGRALLASFKFKVLNEGSKEDCSCKSIPFIWQNCIAFCTSVQNYPCYVGAVK